jgi:hypothetical protein
VYREGRTIYCNKSPTKLSFLLPRYNSQALEALFCLTKTDTRELETMVFSTSSRYFTEFTIQKAVFYTIASVYVAAAGVIVTLQPFLTIPCQYIPNGSEPKTENALYTYNPCHFRRYYVLLGLTVEECEFGRR